MFPQASGPDSPISAFPKCAFQECLLQNFITPSASTYIHTHTHTTLRNVTRRTMLLHETMCFTTAPYAVQRSAPRSLVFSFILSHNGPFHWIVNIIKIKILVINSLLDSSTIDNVFYIVQCNKKRMCMLQSRYF